MAAPSVHQKSGNCTVCGKLFDKTSMVLNIRKLEVIGESKFITRYKACGTCYNEHYSKGE